MRDGDNLLELLKGVRLKMVGVGVTAYNRIGPAFFYPNYEIVCYKNSSDVGELEKWCKVVSVQKDLAKYGGIDRLNSLDILRHKGVQDYLRAQEGEVGIYMYRTTKRIDALCAELGVKVLANSHEIRDKYEDKQTFFKMGREMGLPMIPGEQWVIDELGEDEYRGLVERLGGKLVFQVTEYSRGGGKGTVFVFSMEDFRRFKVEIEKKREKKKLVNVNVTRYIEGVSPSITGCVTRNGVLVGQVQTQVVDVEELPHDKSRSGVFQGHDWSYRQYSDKVQEQAEGMVVKLGEQMAKSGYKGVFGVDLIVDEESEEVYPVECNPRYTGAFPVYTMLQMAGGEVPLDVFQLLEFLEVEYECDVDRVNRSWKRVKMGAHLVLSNPYCDVWVEVVRAPKAGVYRLEKGELVRLREGVCYQDIESEEEFVLADGVPLPGQKVKPGLRFGKLVFKRGVLERPGELNKFAAEVVKVVYGSYELRPIERRGKE